MTWKFWWLRGHTAEHARLADDILANTERLPPHQRVIALGAAGFILISNGDQPGRSALRADLPVYRQVSDKLGVVTRTASCASWDTSRPCAANTPAPPTCSARARPYYGRYATTTSPDTTAFSTC